MATDLLFNRFSEVVRRASDQHGPGEVLFVAVYCNGCGEKAVANSVETLRFVTDDWDLSDEFGGDDFCPRCR